MLLNPRAAERAWRLGQNLEERAVFVRGSEPGKVACILQVK